MDTWASLRRRQLSDYSIDVFPLDQDWPMEFGPSCGWYWRVSLGKLRINGGLCAGLSVGRDRAAEAVYTFEWSEFREKHYWDVETGSWFKRGELPD